MPGTDFQTIELLFRRTGVLPALPSTAVRLIKSIDTGEASAADLERIIVADPALSAEFLRMASVAAFGGVPRYSTIRGAIMLLGQKTVRALTMSLILRHMSFSKPNTSHFDPARFSRHSLGVAILSRFLFARKQMAGRPTSDWSADEVFAVGLLSSLGIGLLANVAPVEYDRVYHFAARAGIDLETSFQKVYGKPTTLLTAAAFEAWEMPPLFSEALVHLHEPWSYMQEFTALCCLNYSIALCDTHGLSIGSWEVPFALSPEVEMECAVPEEEVKNLITAITHQVDDWGQSKAA